MPALFLLLISLPAWAARPLDCPCLAPDRAVISEALPQVVEGLRKIMDPVLRCGITANDFQPQNEIPPWLAARQGSGKDQIAPVVLERARANYREKIKGRDINSLCYMAMDATKPHREADGRVENRFYLICESLGIYLPMSSGHGSGVQFQDFNFTNDKKCVKHFSNSLGSLLTMGGRFLTGTVTESYKGMMVNPQTKQTTEFIRPFVRFSGEGETASSDIRDIGGHPAKTMAGGCFKYDPASMRADKEGYVYYGDVVEYADGRSNGCTSWNPQVADFVVDVLRSNPAALYIYPESKDIVAVHNALQTKSDLRKLGLYWNQECLQDIGTPNFLPADEYDAVFAKIAQQKADQAAKKPPAPKKLCPGSPTPTTMDSSGKDEG